MPGTVFSLRDLAVDGKALMALGVKQGPEVGRILESLLKAVVEDGVPNEKEKTAGTGAGGNSRESLRYAAGRISQMASLIRRCDVICRGAKILTAVTAGSFKGDESVRPDDRCASLDSPAHEIIIYAYPLWYGGERKKRQCYGFG